MKILSCVLSRAGDLADVEPLLALFLGATLLAVFSLRPLQPKPAPEPGSGLLWILTLSSRHTTGLGADSRRTSDRRHFSASHLSPPDLERFPKHPRPHHSGKLQRCPDHLGRRTAASGIERGYLPTEQIHRAHRIGSPPSPPSLGKKRSHVSVAGNPLSFPPGIKSAPAKSAPKRLGVLWGIPQTECEFNWRLRNPADSAQKCDSSFPLPAARSVYDGLHGVSGRQEYCAGCRSRTRAWFWNATCSQSKR